MPKKKPKKPKRSINFLSKLKDLFSFTSKSKPTIESAIGDLRNNDNNELSIAEQEIINNFSGFSKKLAEDIMITRSDIVAVPVDISLNDLIQVIIKHGHTRTIVYKKNLDNIVGFVHIKDLFLVMENPESYNLQSLTRKHIVAPNLLKLTKLLTEMQIHRTHIAVIFDEYGGVAGLVTIEDIIEEIVGEMADEHDNEEDEGYEIIKPGLIVSSARLEVRELENILSLKLKLEDDEFETIGGLIMAKTGEVPIKGQVIEISDKLTVEILDSTPRTIKQIKIKHHEKLPPQSSKSQ
ncbi:MAG: HlyC/CorC family transporter [Rickettsiaceae bacterium]|nr:HlyC/CorC family transporter [Rickettsiaceae bacterium]